MEDNKDIIFVKGARTNNLKNIDIAIPKKKLVVVSGVSGSGKSTLVMDTLFAEGQRRYVESLSSYARQFLNRMKKPDIEYIKGICPAIAIEQKVSTSNARSSVGSSTELFDYLRLLFARAGKTYSPISGRLVTKHDVKDIVQALEEMPEKSKIRLLIPLQNKYPDRTVRQELNLLRQKGYARILLNQELEEIDDVLIQKNKLLDKKIADVDRTKFLILIDRFILNKDDAENKKRMADSITTALQESFGECILRDEKNQSWSFNNRFEMDGMEFTPPSPHMFNFNNPYGACPKCEGFGTVIGIDENKVIADPMMSVYEGTVIPWEFENGKEMKSDFIKKAFAKEFPIHRSYCELNPAEKKLLWYGDKDVHGIYHFFDVLEQNIYKIQNRVMLARFRGKTNCMDCQGSRLRKDALYVSFEGKNIADLSSMPIDELYDFFQKIDLTKYDKIIAERLIKEIVQRLEVMVNIGLGYLTLNRPSATLSGGETQRINLTRILGSNLTHSLYILDEPSVGLHPRDTENLIKVLQQLRDLGNTVLVVEHEEAILRSADHLIDIGPFAGEFGGKVVFEGKYQEQMTPVEASLTVQYLQKNKTIPIPKTKRTPRNWIKILGARQHNLKKIDVKIPLQSLVVISGVSGSGKSTLVKNILYPALKAKFNEPTGMTIGLHDSLEFDTKAIQSVEMVTQSPIGKSSRSNPVTYVKAYDEIRDLYAKQPFAKLRGYKPGHFSFNVEGGRCEVCKGEGEITVEMQFLADVHLECEECQGKRFQKEVLEIKYKDKNIFEVLSMSIEESLTFFQNDHNIYEKIKPLNDVGLGYVRLGQPSSTLSGGEAQRVKLASFLGAERPKNKMLFIFDEPTTGLHFYDVEKLLIALQALVEQGHSVLVVEHNLDVVKVADWVIDLGPDGGIGGGHLLYSGPPELLKEEGKSITAKYL